MCDSRNLIQYATSFGKSIPLFNYDPQQGSSTLYDEKAEMGVEGCWVRLSNGWGVSLKDVIEDLMDGFAKFLAEKVDFKMKEKQIEFEGKVGDHIVIRTKRNVKEIIITEEHNLLTEEKENPILEVVKLINVKK